MTEIEVRQPRPQAQAAMLPAKVQYARELANSGLLPAAYRRNPGNVLYAVEFGEMLGLAPMAAITGVHVIEGKPTASAGLISALVRRAGHKLRVQGDGKSATCQIVRADDPDFTFEVTWTLRKNGDANPSAEEAGLLNKSVWRNYPASMLKSRAITQCARDACEEALFGLHYTAEEMGAEVDEDGVVVAEIVSDAQPQDTPAGDPWYVHPSPEQAAAAEEWVAAALRIIPDIGMEACQKLWEEAFEKGSSGEVSRPEAVKVRTALKARMEALANPPQDAEVVPPAEPETASLVAAALDPDDPWASAIEAMASAEDGETLLMDVADQRGRGEIDPERAATVERAIEAAIADRFPDADKAAA
jgi:hypothetical protein